MPITLLALALLTLALLLLVVLVFLYKIMIALGGLDRRLEQFGRHLRDLNLVDLHAPDAGILGTATDLDLGGTRGGTTGELRTPATGEIRTFTPPSQRPTDAG